METNGLVSTAWLADHLQAANMRVVDIRGHVLPASEPPPHYFNHHADYLISHIPDAVFVDWVHEITDPADPRHAQIAPPERFAAAMSRAGIGDDTFVVVYDDAGGMFAARLWWALNYYGHSQVAVLDGGWQKWVAEGRPVSDVLPTFAPTTFTARPDPAWYRDGAQVLAALNSPTRLVDMRGAEEFRGEASRAVRKGHIPSAVNQPRRDLLGEDGALLPPEVLREKFAALGVTDDSEEVVFYCNAGVSASFGLLALRAAGIDAPAAVYDGSWKDWGNDPEKPIA
jgi:thiosulfate/3-mercaptopyruvate sulfurtransferase